MTLIAPRRFSSGFRSMTKANLASLPHQLPVRQKQKPMNPESFFEELKRRKVSKIAVAHAVVPWLLIYASNEDAIDSMVVCPTL